MKNIRIFYLKLFQFWVVKFSVYLNRRVFVMSLFSGASGRRCFVIVAFPKCIHLIYYYLRVLNKLLTYHR